MLGPSLRTRAEADELMDDFSITDERLTQALDELRGVNRFLGGYAAMRAVMGPYLRRRRGRRVRVLDLGAGVADIPEHLVRWATRHGADVEVLAVDANAATVAHARAVLDRRLPAPLRPRVRVAVGDAFALPFEDDAFEVTMAAMFLHHFRAPEAVRVLREMQRTARDGLLVNDLQRHRLAYLGIRALTALLPVSPMFAHDGPLSVRRGFTRAELAALAQEAGLTSWALRWHWAFRWTLATLARPDAS